MSDATASASMRLVAALVALSRRMFILAALRGAVAGMVLGGVGLVLAWTAAAGGYGSPGFLVLFASWRPVAVWLLLSLCVGMAGAIQGRLRTAWLRGGAVLDAAHVVEARVPGCRNIVLSAVESLKAPSHTSILPRSALQLRVRQLVLEEAVEWVERHPARQMLPLARPAGALAASLMASLLLGFVMLESLERGMGEFEGVREALAWDGQRGGEEGLVGIRVLVRIVPPAYTGEEAVEVQDPEWIEALRGSRLELMVDLLPSSSISRVNERSRTDEGDRVDNGPQADARGPLEVQGTLETLEGRQPLHRDGTRRLRAEVQMDANGFLSLDVEQGSRSTRRLIGLGVVDDPAPRVRILEPGRDLYLPDGNRTLRLEVEATDDRALASLDLLFTRVRGFGELFEFEEGRLPLRITPHTPDRWTGFAEWDLSDLELDRGDVLVYRAEARDERPGALPGESETWTLEILGSDAAPVGGFAGEDEMSRYALSQQMVLVLTEELRSGRDTLSGSRLLEESRVLAAAQRRVRAEFVFMLGGELEDEHLHDASASEPDAHDHGSTHDRGTGQGRGAATSPTGDPDAPSAQELHEEAHARADADAAEGRLAQEGRIELARAIRAMSQAVTHLNQAALEEALEAEALALEHLQRAFSSSRYLLRALSEREELDPGRRLTGERSAAVPHRRPLLLAEPDPVEVELRLVLDGLLRLALAPTPAASPGPPGPTGPAEPPGPAESSGPAGWAARLLAVDPASPRFRDLASRLVDLDASWSGGGAPAREAQEAREAREAQGARAAGEASEEGESWRAGVEGVIVELGRYLRDRHLAHPGAGPPSRLLHLEGAWADALRGAAGEGEQR